MFSLWAFDFSIAFATFSHKRFVFFFVGATCRMDGRLCFDGDRLPHWDGDAVAGVHGVYRGVYFMGRKYVQVG